MEVNDVFRENLKSAREAAGMDAWNLSLKAGLGERAVKDIEEGRSQSPKISTVFALAKVLNMEAGVLLGLGPRPKLKSELVEFLQQYDEAEQERLLTALSALPGPKT